MTYKEQQIFQNILNILEISINEFDNYSKDDLKHQYRLLAKKYHPDSSGFYSDNANMQKINEAYEKIKSMINSGTIKLKNNFTNASENEVKNKVKYSDNLYNRLDKITRIINNKKREILNTKAKEVLDSSLEIINLLKKIINQENNLYSHMLLENLTDLLEYYYSKVLKINNNNITFDINYNENTIFLYEKKKLYTTHKRLIFEEVKNLIDIFSKLNNYQINYEIYKKRENEIMNKINRINEDALNIDIYMKVANADKEKVNKRIKELK